MAKKASIKKEEKALSQFEDAALEAGVEHVAGKGAIEAGYRSRITLQEGCSFTASIDIDTHFNKLEPNSPRWDYGLGVKLRNGVEVALWVEPHPASSTGEVKKMLSKLDWLKEKLETKDLRSMRALRDAAVAQKIKPYRWQVSLDGAIRITPKSNEARLLALKGLEVPSRHIKLP